MIFRLVEQEGISRKVVAVCGVILVLLAQVARAQSPGLPASPNWPKWATVRRQFQANAYAWSLDGKHFAYSDSAGVWLVDAPDFDRPRLVQKTESVSQVAWSPDASRLAFVGIHRVPVGVRSERPIQSTIWITDLEGSPATDLLPAGSIAQPEHQIDIFHIESWLPSNKIAFSTGVGTGYVEHFAVDTKSGEIHRFCDSTGQFFWALDGRTAIVQNDAPQGDTPSGLGLLQFARAWSHPSPSCSTLVQTPAQAILDFNDWSSDSAEVTYTASTSREGSDDLFPTLYKWSVNDEAIEIFMRGAECGSWSSDNRQLALLALGHLFYGRNREFKGTREPYNQASLVVLNLAERALSGVVRLPDSMVKTISNQFGSRSECPKWGLGGKVSFLAPDGTVYLLRTGQPAARTRSFKLPVGNFDRIAPWSVEWSPDGKWLVVNNLHFGREKPLVTLLEPQ